MVVTTVGVSRVYRGNFLSRSSVRHGGRIVRRRNIPSIGHHELEVSIIVDTCTDVSVILKPFLGCDLSIILPTCNSIVMLFKSF